MQLRDDMELSARQFRQPAGFLKPWVQIVLVLACIATVLLPFAGTRVLWLQGGETTGVPRWLFENVLAIVAVIAITAIAWPRFRQSRFVRLAILLPVAHVGLVAIAWPAWLAISAHMDSVERWYYLASDLPLSAVITGELVIVVAAAALIAHRRRDTEWTHAFVMIALVDLLLLGLWLPLVAWATCHGSWRLENDPSFAMAHVVRLTAIVMGPPLVASIGYALFAIRRPERAAEMRVPLLAAGAVLFVVSFVLRADSPPAARVVYANYIHVMLGAMVVATAGPLLLGIGVWLRARMIRRRLATHSISGVVVSEDNEPVIACYEIAGWLRPPRPLVRAFTLVTTHGEVPVPGARLAAPIDPATTVLAVDESFAALRAGDRVTVSVTSAAQPSSDPFRSLAAPMLGTDPVLAPFGLPALTFSDLALSLWRPAVAYLVILVALAGPALAALLAPNI